MVSIVVATRNRASYLKRMLEGLFEQDYPHLDIVVVDGASGDGTVELLKSYGSRISRWVSEPDEGEYFAYNKGLSMAKGDVIKFMTDDDLLRPGALRCAADYFIDHPDVDIVFGQTAFWTEEPGGARFLGDPCMMDLSRLSLWHWLREKQDVTSVAAFVRRRVFELIGPLATKYDCGDVEFWARAASHRIKMGLMPQLVVDYYLTGENGVIRKRPGLVRGIVSINARYGNLSDVWDCVWRHILRPALDGMRPAIVCDRLGIHPLRFLRKVKNRVAP